MFCSPIVGPTPQDIYNQLTIAESQVDLAELRLDLWNEIELDQLQAFRNQFSKPWLVTLRSIGHGGKFDGSQESQMQLLAKITTLSPEYMDVEADIPQELYMDLRARGGNIRWILSHHDTRETPKDLESMMEKMEQLPAEIYKIAVRSNNSSEALKLLEVGRRASRRKEGQWVCIGMGEYGVPTRILAAAVGSPILFGALDERWTSAPGQLLISTLRTLYKAQELTMESHWLALLGDPIDKSSSYLRHNSVLRALGLPGVYFNLRTPPHELQEVCHWMHQLPFLGASVTMPLKEKILEWLDDIDPTARAIGAVNTLKLSKGQLKGYNTDGEGALNAIEEKWHRSVKGMNTVIFGAGGAGRAIAWEALKRGARVSLANRSEARAQEAAMQIGCHYLPISKLRQAIHGCELFVQATSVGMTPNDDISPVNPSDFQPHTLLLDVVTHPATTKLLRLASARGCPTVNGLDMLTHQALLQWKIWHKESNIHALLIRERYETPTFT